MPVTAIQIEVSPSRLPTQDELDDVRRAVRLCKALLREVLKEQAQDLNFSRDRNVFSLTFRVQREDLDEVRRCVQGIINAASPFLDSWEVLYHECWNGERLPCRPWTVIASSGS